MLLKVAGRWRTVARADNPEAYVERIMTNAAIDLARKRRRDHRVEAVDVVEHQQGPIAERDAVRRLLAQLPAQQRAVVVLRHLEDRPEAEVAELLGISVGTVKSHNSRVLARLRELLSQEETESAHH